MEGCVDVEVEHCLCGEDDILNPDLLLRARVAAASIQGTYVSPTQELPLKALFRL